MQHTDKAGYGARVSASAARNTGAVAGAGFGGRYHCVCRNPDGDIKWVEQIKNLVTDEGINYALDAALSGGTPITSWFIILTDSAPTVAAGDTLASHAGWAEFTNYSGSRKAWTDGGVSAKSVDNVGNEAAFVIDTDAQTIGGAGLSSVASGTSGTLYSVGAFTGGDKTGVDDGDTLNVTYTATGQDV